MVNVHREGLQLMGLPRSVTKEMFLTWPPREIRRPAGTCWGRWRPCTGRPPPRCTCTPAKFTLVLVWTSSQGLPVSKSPGVLEVHYPSGSPHLTERGNLVRNNSYYGIGLDRAKTNIWSFWKQKVYNCIVELIWLVQLPLGLINCVITASIRLWSCHDKSL